MSSRSQKSGKAISPFLSDQVTYIAIHVDMRKLKNRISLAFYTNYIFSACMVSFGSCIDSYTAI